MIGINIGGDLGNQMFRYACGRALVEFKGDNNFVLRFVNKNHSLLEFNIYKKRLLTKDIVLSEGTFLQKILYVFFKVLYKFVPVKDRNLIRYPSILLKNGVCLAGNINDFDLSPAVNHDTIFLNGTFENPMYFADIRHILLKEFVPRHPLQEKNFELHTIIKQSNSICLSIRRGDFLTKENKGWFDVCDLKYFQAAIERMQELVKNPVFIIFSNDIKWAKENIHIEGECYFESGDDPVWETLRLMCSCKHFIISNSTFHWWAQYLSDNEDKIVISPNRWYNAPGPYPLILENFIKIEV